jgi:hypothetical protein
VKRPIFLDLRLAELEAATPGLPGLFLGRLDAAMLRRELEEAGILSGLAERGYASVRIRTSLESGEHRLRLLPLGSSTPLLDLRMTESSTFLKDPRMSRLGLEVLSFLAMSWLTLQDPRRGFTADRPALPGQEHPGLGISRRVYARLLLWAEDWGKDGLLNFPEYYHNASIYSRAFRFLSPVRQGRFEALQRALANLPLATASRLVHEGGVRDEAAGAPLVWQPAEMVAATSTDVRLYLDSPDYQAAAAAAAAAARFRVTR